MATSTTSSSSSVVEADDRSGCEGRSRARDTSVNSGPAYPSYSNNTEQTTSLARRDRNYPHYHPHQRPNHHHHHRRHYHATKGSVHRDSRPPAGGGVTGGGRSGDETKASACGPRGGLVAGVGQPAGTARRRGLPVVGSSAAARSLPRDSGPCARRSACSGQKAGGSTAVEQGAGILGTDRSDGDCSGFSGANDTVSPTAATTNAKTAAVPERLLPDYQQESLNGKAEVSASSPKLEETSFNHTSSSPPPAQGPYRRYRSTNSSAVDDDDCEKIDSADNGEADDKSDINGSPPASSCAEHNATAAELTDLGLIQNFRGAAGLTAEQGEGVRTGGIIAGDLVDDIVEETEEEEEGSDVNGEERGVEGSLLPQPSGDVSTKGQQGVPLQQQECSDTVGEWDFPASGCGSQGQTQYRRLESRRGSSVTFILPAHVSSGGDNSSQSSSRVLSIATEEGAQLQESYFANLYARRMSAPELPPIADRERHRPPSRSNSKSSLNQLTTAVTNKNFYTRLATGGSLTRNHSDSSLKGLLASSQGPTQSSGSVSSYPSGGFGGRGTPGAGDGGMPPPQIHRCASRALSWCATDNSNGSVPKLETLFERKNAPPVFGNLNPSAGGGGGPPGFQLPATPPSPGPLQVLKNSNNNNISGVPNQNRNNVIPPRSVSVNGLRPNDAQELAKIKSRKKRQQSECGAGEVETLATIEQFGSLKMNNGMRRVLSDNRLSEKKKNVRNARLNSSRHLSVSRTDKLTDKTLTPSNLSVPSSLLHHHHHHHQRRTSRHGGASTVSGTKGMRRVNSVSGINSVAAPNNKSRNRMDSNQDSENNADTPGGGSEDSEEEEEHRSCRIREWLLGLDYADDPPEPVIEYADDPPQTDTAVHIVYKDGS